MCSRSFGPHQAIWERRRINVATNLGTLNPSCPNACARGAVALLVGFLLGACATDELNPAADASQQADPADAEPPAVANPRLAKVCRNALDLIDSNQPGTVPRKKAVALANEAFFADDSGPVTEAFSNLNNVYVFDDGTSSEAEVRAQLAAACA